MEREMRKTIIGRIVLSIVGLGIAAGAMAQGASASESLEAKIRRIENSLIPTLHIKGTPVVPASLADRMSLFKVPAVSVAVAKDGKIEWAKAYGLRDVEAKSPAGPETLFQAASISKAVTAAAALHFVERNILDLDEDVNVKLLSWQVPENGFTAKQKVTLRRILSHSAGLTVHGFPGYPAGQALPTLKQVLDGEKPANTDPIRVDALPGFRWRYSGGGYTVLQQLLIDVLGRPFPDILKETVLDPAGMTESAFAQPLPEGLLARAAVGYSSEGKPVEGRRYVYPELAAAGLWTTPTDLLKFALEISAAREGKSEKILSRPMTQVMLRTEKAPSSLGFFPEGEGADFRFGHSGGNAGFECDLIYFPERGIGMAVMTNSDNGGALMNQIERAIAAEYGLPDFRPVVEKAIIPVDAAVLAGYAGEYEIVDAGQKIPVTIAVKGDHLAATAMGETTEVYPESETKFFAMDLSLTLVFLKNAEARISGIMVNNAYTAARK